MKNYRVIIFLIISSLLASCVSREQKQNTISISGAFALYPLVVKWAEEYKKENPGIRFNISGGGAGKGMADALSQTVDLGMFSRDISQEEIDKGAWWVGLTIDAVLPTINAENPNLSKIKQHGMSREDFARIFIDGNVNTWNEVIEGGDEGKITVYTRSDACGAAGTWAQYLGGKQENLIGIGIYGDPGLADAVAKDKNGMGFNNTIYIYDIKTGKKRTGIEVIPVDIDGNGIISEGESVYDSFPQILRAIAIGKYPSPPARELYFVARGKPEKEAVLSFIRWVLTEGQKYVSETGYVPLEQALLEKYLIKLE